MRTIKQNSGASIKGVADVLFALGAISSVILGVVILVTFADGDGFFVGLIVGILVAGVGCLISWLGTLALRGYGEIIMYTAENATYLEEIERLLAQNAQTSAPAPGKGKASAQKTVAEVAAQTTPDSSSTVYCGVCGAKNYYKNQACVNCGHILNR